MIQDASPELGPVREVDRRSPGRATAVIISSRPARKTPTPRTASSTSDARWFTAGVYPGAAGRPASPLAGSSAVAEPAGCDAQEPLEAAGQVGLVEEADLGGDVRQGLAVEDPGAGRIETPAGDVDVRTDPERRPEGAGEPGSGVAPIGSRGLGYRDRVEQAGVEVGPERLGEVVAGRDGRCAGAGPSAERRLGSARRRMRAASPPRARRRRSRGRRASAGDLAAQTCRRSPADRPTARSAPRRAPSGSR